MDHADPILRSLCRGLTPWQQVELVAARQGRAIHVGQLRDCGLSASTIKTATAHRHLNRVHRGVRAVGIRHLSPAGRRWAAHLAAGPDTALGHDTGAALNGFRPDDGRTVHIAAPSRRRNHRAVVVHDVAGLHPSWIHHRAGLPVMRPAHLLLDLAATLRAEALAIAINQALALRAVTVTELASVTDQRPRHRGRRRLAAALDAVVDDPGGGRTHGELEALVLLRLRELPGLPPFRRNTLVELGGGRLARADLLFPGPRVMVELDSRRWHEQRAAMDSDRRKDHQALAAGIVLFRITWRHAVHEWDAVAADLRTTLAGRQRGVREPTGGRTGG